MFYALRTGLYMVPVTNCILGPILLLIYFLGGWRLDRRRVGEKIAVGIRAGFWLIPALWMFATGYAAGTPRAMFQRLLRYPMPVSAKDFQWRGGAGIDGFYHVTFTAAPADVKAMIEYGHLQRDTNFTLDASSGLYSPDQYVSNKVVWAWPALPYQPLELPVIYNGTGIQLITDGAHRRVYIFL